MTERCPFSLFAPYFKVLQMYSPMVHHCAVLRKPAINLCETCLPVNLNLAGLSRHQLSGHRVIRLLVFSDSNLSYSLVHFQLLFLTQFLVCDSLVGWTRIMLIGSRQTRALLFNLYIVLTCRKIGRLFLI